MIDALAMSFPDVRISCVSATIGPGIDLLSPMLRQVFLPGLPFEAVKLVILI